MDIHDLGIARYEGFIPPNIYKPMDYTPFIPSSIGTPKSYEEEFKLNIGDIVAKKKVLDTSITAPDCKPVELDTITGLTITTAESWSPIKTIETTGNIEEKPLNIKIVKKQIKLNFKN